MTTRQGYMKKRGTNDPVALKTLDTLVKDTVRNQALSASLVNLIERNALGFPPFSTVTAYAVGDIVFYDRRLYKFTAAKTAGAWDSTKVTEFSIKEYAAVSLSYGVCTTGTYDAAKTVNIPHFMLLENVTIKVLFTTPINTDNTTLNVSLTGAKPIRILGQNLPAGVIKAQTYATLAYDGTAWNIVDIFCPDAQFDPAALVVDMGLPSGTKWAARDIDLTKPGGFCETPFTYEKSFFSWGNIDGHNPSSVSAFDYNWGGVNAQEPWYEDQPYGSTPGNTLTGNIAVGEAFDAARANLGAPWRMPTTGEYAELFANIRYINADGTPIDSAQTNKLVTVNGIVGLYLESTINSARLFFSCSGDGYGRSWGDRGSGGNYWSSAWDSARYARGLGFGSGGVYPRYYNYRYFGFAVRPVQ